MKNYKQSSMVDIAFELMTKRKKPINFYELWENVAQIKDFTTEQKEENESLFYTNISLDGRMITVGENNWDLRSRHKFEDVHIDMNDIYSDDETEEEDDDDGVEEDDYN